MVKKRVNTSPECGNRIDKADSSSDSGGREARISSASSRLSPYQNVHSLKGRTLKKARVTSIGGPDSEIPKPLCCEMESTNPGIKERTPDGDTKSARRGMRSDKSLLSKSRAADNEIWLMVHLSLYQTERDALTSTGLNERISN